MAKKFFLCPKCCVVVYATPRLLVAKVKATALDLTVAVGHAPHNQAPEAERDAFWKAVESLNDKWAFDILLLDANARLGEVTSEYVGCEQHPQPQDKNGDALH
eukprot:7402045-Pyramimonas_sp.AAC.1